MNRAIVSGLSAAALTSVIFVVGEVANGYAQSSDVTAAVSSSTQGTVVRH